MQFLQLTRTMNRRVPPFDSVSAGAPWARKCNLLCKRGVLRSGLQKKLALMQCTSTMYRIDTIVGCVCLGWAILNEVDYAVSSHVSSRHWETITVEAQLAGQAVGGINCLLHVVQYIYGISLFVAETFWSHQHFSINRI